MSRPTSSFERDQNTTSWNTAIAWIIEGDMAKAARLAEQYGRYNSWELNYLKFAADMSRTLGRLELAHQFQSRVLARDPLCAYCRRAQFHILAALGQLTEAEHEARLLIQLEPERDLHRFNLGKVLLLAGKTGQAMETFEGIGDETLRLSGLAMARYSFGEFGQASRDWKKLRSCELGAYVCAQVAAWLGYQEDSVRLLNEWIDTPGNLVSFQVEFTAPILANLHGTPGWNQVLERIGRSPERLANIEFSPLLQNEARLR